MSPNLFSPISAPQPTIDQMLSSRANSTSSTASYSSSDSSSPPLPAISSFPSSEDSEDNDNEIILVPVRLSTPFRRGSKLGAEDLPSRPPARSFMRRISTRLNMDHSAEKEMRYKAVKMPRGEYKRYFRRDEDGQYAGTEAEREWEEGEVVSRYAEFQGRRNGEVQ